jgi:hypothetical protein
MPEKRFLPESDRDLIEKKPSRAQPLTGQFPKKCHMIMQQ